jgi:LPS export ABC transporter protein LptC
MSRGIILLVLTVTISFACSDTLPVKKGIISKDDLPSVSIKNLKTSYTEQGKIKAKIQAELLQKFDDIIEPYWDFPKGINVLLFNEKDIIETSLSAKRAIYYQSKETWEAIGNVVISNINGDILQTEKLYGDQKEKKIFTDQFVKITKADGTVIKGEKGFESNTEFTIYQFIDVSGKITFKEEFESVAEDSTSIAD